MKLISWNIDSLNAALTSTSDRAILSKKVLEDIAGENPEIIALQETKLSASGPSKKHLEILGEIFKGYKIVWRSSVEPARKGYAGTMFLVREDISFTESFPKIDAPDTMDDEGRIITLELENVYVSQVYTPNAGDGLKRLTDRMVWDVRYADYLENLAKNKAVLACGDFNVAHTEIDLAHPENNHMSAGFTDQERMGFTNLLSRGLIDTFRYLNKDLKGVYSWWAQRVKTSKINNSGWRIDYWLVSENIKEKIKASYMMDSGARQDHTPIVLDIDL